MMAAAKKDVLDSVLEGLDTPEVQQAAQPAAPGALGAAMNTPTLVQQAGQAIADERAAQKEAAVAVQANIDQRNKLLSEETPRVEIPRLKELPARSDFVTPPKDPMRAMGQFLPILAAFGGLFTRNAATNTLNAATAAINAAKANDQKELERQHKEWLDNLRMTVDSNNQTIQEYRLALEDRNATVTERMAKVQALAAERNDRITLAALKGGNPGAVLNLLKIVEEAGNNLARVQLGSEENEIARQKAADQALQGWAELAIKQKQLGRLSMGEAMGTILDQVAKNGLGSLSQGQKDALIQYKELNESRTTPWQLPTQPDAKAPAPAAPQTAPATAAPPAAAPATAARPGAVSPPATMLKSGTITYLRSAGGQVEGWTLEGGKPKFVGLKPGQ